MKGRTPLAERDQKAPARGELSIVVACNGLHCAIEAKYVERLVLPDEVKDLGVVGEVRVIEAGDHRYAAWDLGVLFDRGPTGDAWVLMHLPWRKGLRVALATGSCLFVRPIQGATPLPHGIFSTRVGALSACLAMPHRQGEAQSQLVLGLDVTALFREGELASGARSIAAATGQATARATV